MVQRPVEAANGKRNESRDTARAMSEENVEIVRRLYAAVARRDAETVLSIYHPEVEWDHTQNEGVAGLMGTSVWHGHEGIRQWSRDWYEA